jgi:nucleotide-binding universal stress UspA family protein
MDYNIRTILHATDLGAHGPAIFNHAFVLAKQFGAKIHIVHALEPISEYGHAMVETYVPPEMLESVRNQGFEAARKEMHRRLEKFCEDKLHADAHTVVADMRVVEGMPAQVILDEAKRLNADLIVLGTHGLSALGEIFLGSVAHKVIMRSPVPVFLVPIKRDA